MKGRQRISMRICLAVFLIGIFIQGAAAAGTAPVQTPEGLVKAAETDQLILYYTAVKDGIVILDKRSGYMWNSAVTQEQYTAGKLNNAVRSKVTALFDFRYVQAESTKQTVVAVNFLTHKPEVVIEKSQNGIKLLYEFPSLGITVCVDASIKGSALTVEIPANQIKEEGKYHLVSLELLPFMGSAQNTEDGYMFYPDGCGALYRFKDEPGQNISKSSFYIYGADQVDLSEYGRNRTAGLKTAMLPVFGVKKGNSAFLGVIDEGDFDAAVNVTPSGFSNIHLNRISAEFTCRRGFEDLRDNPNIPPRIEDRILVADRAVKYYFLTGEDADYSGMANAYRQYLLDGGRMTARISRDNGGIPMALDLFMGIKEERILLDKYRKATTFRQAETILDSFFRNGVDNMEVNLIGWNSNGLGMNPSAFPPDSRLGGTKGLKELAKYTGEKGFSLYLDVGFTEAKKEAGGFSVRNDTVFKKNGLVVSDRSNSQFLLNPFRALERLRDSFLPKVSGSGINGLCFEDIGSQLYHDYNDRNPATRRITAGQWGSMLLDTAGTLGKSGVHGGNAYVLKYADRLIDIPVEDSGMINTDEAIPFYQMVVHGFIPYTSTPGNLFYDFQKQKLKWVEYGCMPYFKLTYSKADILRYTEYNALFSSDYDLWVESASDTYREMNERVGGLWSRQMVRHEQIGKEIYKVTYNDGTRVYVNYQDREVRAEGIRIKAVDYAVADKEGNVR